ncbi:MAG: HisA/HisF-related TIM barrel protein [Planctomycetota bacterium]|nr:HisA/HisF-related TIM barrel protein [Planctomycetota bacterium]
MSRNRNTQLIPVIDLMGGRVVHAIAGDRKQYRPFRESRFTMESVPEMARQMIDRYAPRYFYLADLDAIEKKPDNRDLLSDLLELPVHWLLDPGFETASDYFQFRQGLNATGSTARWSPVFGSETLVSAAELAHELRGEIPDVFVSLDILGGKVLGNAPLEPDRPRESLQTLLNLGFRNLIVLELDAVGVGCSVKDRTIVDVRACCSGRQIFAGGGIRTSEDLGPVLNNGFSGALVSSALHNGSIPPGILTSFGDSKVP